jgi:hypothetical protein
MYRFGVSIFALLTVAALALSVMTITQSAVEADRLRDPEYVRMLEDKKYFEEVIAPAGLPMHPAGHYTPIEKRSDGTEQ